VRVAPFACARGSFVQYVAIRSPCRVRIGTLGSDEQREHEQQMSPRISIRLLATQPDERLIALAREGHERAFETLVRRYRRPLLRYCQRLRLSDARGEDVVQQALLKAWLALCDGAEVREPRAWLHRIVHNTAVNAIRGTREVPTDPGGVLRVQTASGESELERTLAVRDALGNVAALPQLQRDAVLLTAVDGHSHDEVASALGVSRGAVRGLLYRARATLRGATAALTPTPLLEWAARGAGSAAPSAERIAELTGGAGVAGIAGALAKSAAVAVSVGALATGVVVVKSHRAESAASHPHDTAMAAERLASVRQSAADAPASDAATPVFGTDAPTSTLPHATRGSRRSARRRVALHATPRDGRTLVAVGGAGDGRRLLADAGPVLRAPAQAGGLPPGGGGGQDERSARHERGSSDGSFVQSTTGEGGGQSHAGSSSPAGTAGEGGSTPPPQSPGAEGGSGRSGRSGAGTPGSEGDDKEAQANSTSDRSDDGNTEATQEIVSSGEHPDGHTGQD
jgi:RNA polymerase sigma factor (sigma-70 family)